MLVVGVLSLDGTVLRSGDCCSRLLIVLLSDGGTIAVWSPNRGHPFGVEGFLLGALTQGCAGSLHSRSTLG